MSWIAIAAPEEVVMVEEAAEQMQNEVDSVFPRTLMVTSFFAGIVAGVILCRLFSNIRIPLTKQEASREEATKRDTSRFGKESVAIVSARISAGPRIKSFAERKMDSLGLSWKTSGAGSSHSFGGSVLSSRRKGKPTAEPTDSQDCSHDQSSGYVDGESYDSADSSESPHSAVRSAAGRSSESFTREGKQSNKTNWSMSISEKNILSAEVQGGIELPEPEHHFVSTCLFFDIVDFSKACAERSSDQVRDWMVWVHTAVEELTVKHSVRIVECRGDCYICISGTNFTEEDVWETQMMRMVSFGCDVRNQLLEGVVKTRVRIGIAVGPLTIGYIGGNEAGGTNLVAYGDTINTAARMEQNGKEGMMLMTKSAASRLCRETLDKEMNYIQSEIPVNVTYIKSKGLFPTVWFDCGTRNFTKAPRQVVEEQNRALRLSWPAGKEMKDRMDSQELLCSFQAL